jgi:hypothetical protein
MKILLGIILLGYMIFGAVKENPDEVNSHPDNRPEMNIGNEDSVQFQKVVYLDAYGNLIED